MPPIPAAILSEIKSATGCVALLESRGVVLERRGQEYRCRCPLPGHEDRDPSFSISMGKGEGGVCHCFGCHWSGNVLQLVQALDDCSFLDAAVTLARLGGVAFDDSPYRRRGGLVAKPAPPSCPLDPSGSVAEVGRQVVQAYHGQLLHRGSAGMLYLAKRGLADPAVLARHRIGYAERGALGKTLPPKQNPDGRLLRSTLEAQGWFKAGSGHEFFAGSVVVPIFGADGSVVNAYGRKVIQRLRSGTPKHLYLPGSNDHCWNLAAFTSPTGAAAVEQRAIICEAPLDALTFCCHGLEAVTFACGTNGFHPSHLAALHAAQVRDVFIAFDADEEGEAAAVALSGRLIAEGLTVYRVCLPPGADVNRYATELDDGARDGLQAVIRDAVWVGGAPRVAVSDETPAAIAESAAPEAAPPVPVAPQPVGCEVAEQNGDVFITIDGRVYRVRGLGACRSAATLRVNVRVHWNEVIHPDCLDVCQHRQRAQFAKVAAEEVGLSADLVKRDLGKILLICEQRVEERLAAEQESSATASHPVPVMTADDQAAALALLRAPDLLDRIVTDLTVGGLVGEDTNKLACYLAATSRLLPATVSRPLAVLVQSSSAAGKSTLVDAVLDFLPEEARVSLTSISPQALSFFGRDALKHRTLSIAEDEGLGEAAYLLKLLQSEGKISRATTTKDPQTGQPQTTLFEVEGPVQMFLTTTSDSIDEELRNRCLVLAIDEEAAQTAAIHQAQRLAQTPVGFQKAQERRQVRLLHHNAQRLLQPVLVLNPLAGQLQFPTHQTRLRRDHAKYLTLINTIALLHQHQRERRFIDVGDGSEPVTYIAVEEADIAAADRIMGALFHRGLDSLPPLPRRLFDGLCALVRERCAVDDVHDPETVSLTRRDIQASMGWSYHQVYRHLAVLIEQEYVAEFAGAARNLHTYRLAPGVLDDALNSHLRCQFRTGVEQFRGDVTQFRSTLQRLCETEKGAKVHENTGISRSVIQFRTQSGDEQGGGSRIVDGLGSKCDPVMDANGHNGDGSVSDDVPMVVIDDDAHPPQAAWPGA